MGSTFSAKELISFFSERSQSLLWATLAIGFMTMTVIEHLKRYYRHIFHRGQMYYWLTNHQGQPPLEPNENQTANRTQQTTNKAMYELIRLSTAGDERAMFELPLEQLCGQVALGVQSALESPARYKDLLYALTALTPESEQDRLDLDILMSKGFDEYTYAEENWDNKMNSNKTIYLAARNRISNHIQRRIDAYQIKTASIWKNRMRAAALLVSFMISAVIALPLSSLKTWNYLSILMVITGYLGAFTAAIFRDLTAMIEKLRR